MRGPRPPGPEAHFLACSGTPGSHAWHDAPHAGRGTGMAVPVTVTEFR
jgi:hypothetical protein